MLNFHDLEHSFIYYLRSVTKQSSNTTLCFRLHDSKMRKLIFFCLISNAVRDSKTRLAKLKVDSTFTAPCNASILYPEDGGNMHRFTAITACAVLDVLGPPYCNPEGRHCTYFLEFPLDKLSSGQLSILTNHDSLYILKRYRLKVHVVVFRGRRRFEQ